MTSSFEFLYQVLSILGSSKLRNSIVLKGAASLTLSVLASNSTLLPRSTRDLDFHIATPQDLKTFVALVEPVLNNNILGWRFKLEKSDLRSSTSWSGLFRCSTGDTLKMDVNVSSMGSFAIILDANIGLNRYSNLTMLSDKIFAISSKNIFRRVKDVYDIAILAQLESYRSGDILDALRNKRPEFFETGKYMFTPENMEAIKHAYDKLDIARGANNVIIKPPFETLVTLITTFLSPIYGKIYDLKWGIGGWEHE